MVGRLSGTAPSRRSSRLGQASGGARRLHHGGRGDDWLHSGERTWRRPISSRPQDDRGTMTITKLSCTRCSTYNRTPPGHQNFEKFEQGPWFSLFN
jgi:hypothetical protein